MTSPRSSMILARCCSPIPGDDVVGFLNESGSIQIHRTNCKVAIDLMSKYGKRIIKAKWKNKESIGFLTGIKIQGIDKKGFIRKVTEVITEKYNINIRSFHLDTSEGITEGTVMLYLARYPNPATPVGKPSENQGNHQGDEDR